MPSRRNCPNPRVVGYLTEHSHAIKDLRCPGRKASQNRHSRKHSQRVSGVAKGFVDPGPIDRQHSGEASLPLDRVITDRDATISAPSCSRRSAAASGVLRRDLDELIADALAASRVHEPITLGGGGGEGEEWRDGRQFWGGEWSVRSC
jgi:hypothetical protein